MRDLPHTLPDIVEAIEHSATNLADYNLAIRSSLDQLGARAAEDLRKLDVDLSGPEAARVAATVVLYVLHRGRRHAGTPVPDSFADYVATLSGSYDAINGITSAVAQRHREATDA